MMTKDVCTYHAKCKFLTNTRTALPSFIFLSIGQTTRVRWADYQGHFVKCLTLCRWAADQTTKPGSRITRLLSSSKSSRADYHHISSSKRQTTKACKGPWPVRRPSRAHQAGRLWYKQGSRTILIFIICKAAAATLATIKQQRIYLKFDFHPNPAFYHCERSERPLGLGCDNVREQKQQ